MVLAGCLVLVGAGGCAPAPTPAGNTGADQSAPGSTPQTAGAQQPLQVFADGFVGPGQPVRNGGTVHLSASVSADVFVDPYPASGPTTWLDLFLARDGKPITDAGVATDTEMTYMSHGSTHQTGGALGDGHYVLSLTYPMVGLWRHRFTIQVDDVQYVLPLLVTVFPS